MELLHVALQGLRDDAVSHLAHIHVAAGHGESGGLAEVEILDIPQKRNQLLHLDAGGDVGEYQLHNGVERRPVRRLGLIKRLLQDDSLALGSREVRVAQTQAAVGHGLHAVQMV